MGKKCIFTERWFPNKYLIFILMSTLGMMHCAVMFRSSCVCLRSELTRARRCLHYGLRCDDPPMFIGFHTHTHTQPIAAVRAQDRSIRCLLSCLTACMDMNDKINAR